MIEKLKIFALPNASTVSANFEALYDSLFWLSAISFTAVVLAMLYFVFRYRRSKQNPDKTPYIEGHTGLELTVAAILFVIVMGVFYWGWVDYMTLLKSPSNALEINVYGKQWSWDFEYTNGRKINGELVVPKGKPIKLLMTSLDVIHSFYIPDFRVKQDVVPNSYSSLWFEATQTGEFQAYCAEYCGTAHSKMLAKVRVLEPEEYERWQAKWALAEQTGKSVSPDAGSEQALPPIEKGKQLFGAKGCNACHAVTNQRLVGPGLQGIVGYEIELEGNQKVMVDENYVREAITDPQAKVVKGFPPVMPTYKGTLSDEEISALVAYIKNL